MRETVRTAILLSFVGLMSGGCTDIVGEQVIDGRGPLVYESRLVGSFTGVSNTTLADVEILPASADRVWIRAEESIVPYIRTRVQDGLLRIYTDNVTLRPRQAIVVEVDIRTLRRIDSSGSGFVLADLIDARRLEVNATGSGDVDLISLVADSLVIRNSGSGDVTASGTVDRLRVTLSAAGRADTRDLETFEADATLSGSGNATIRVRDHLHAVLSGSGSLRYYGSPTVDQTVTGTGQVQRLGN